MTLDWDEGEEIEIGEPVEGAPQCPVCLSHDVVVDGDYWYCRECMYHWPREDE